jgi:hypothetical protein
MYDVEEDMTIIAQRAADSATRTVALMDEIMNLLEDNGALPTFEYGNKPVTIPELE